MRTTIQCIPMTKTFLSAFVQDNYYCIGTVLPLTQLELPSYDMVVILSQLPFTKYECNVLFLQTLHKRGFISIY